MYIHIINNIYVQSKHFFCIQLKTTCLNRLPTAILDNLTNYFDSDPGPCTILLFDTIF